MNIRSQWRLRHPTQRKYMLTVVIAMLTPTLVMGFYLYHLVFYLLANQMAFPEAVVTNLVPVIQKVNTLLVIVLPVMGLLILWLAVLISHRFAGPIERLESELDRVLKGDTQHRVRVRRKDDLHGVADRINAVLDKLS